MPKFQSMEAIRSDVRSLAARLIIGFFCCAAVLGACGCGSARLFRGVYLNDSSLYINGVPPVLQDDRLSCGPVCLAAVAGYWQPDITVVQKRAKQSNDLGKKFSGTDLTALARQFNLQAYAYKGSEVDLEMNLSKGRPLIVLVPEPGYWNPIDLSVVGINLGFIQGHCAHWVVVLGETRRSFILHDPAYGTVELPKATFLSWWKRKEYICVLASSK